MFLLIAAALALSSQTLASNDASREVRCARILFYNGNTAKTAPIISRDASRFASVEPETGLTIRRVTPGASIEAHSVIASTKVAADEIPASFSLDNRYLLSIHSGATAATIRRASDLQQIAVARASDPERGSYFALVGSRPWLVQMDSSSSKGMVWDLRKPGRPSDSFPLDESFDLFGSSAAFDGVLSASDSENTYLWTWSPVKRFLRSEGFSLVRKGPFSPDFRSNVEFGTDASKSAISDNGSLLALSGFPQEQGLSDNRVAIVDTQSGSTLKVLSFPTTKILDICFARDGRYLAVTVDLVPTNNSPASGIHVFVYDLQNAKYTHYLDLPVGMPRTTISILSSAFAHDNSSYFLTASDGTLYHWPLQ